jgi:THO complex subunit 4
VSAIETGTKLFISNLDYGVSGEDVKELFAEVGDLKRYSIHYDRSGRSKGTAEVVFSRRKDAEAAVKRYHNVQLDGKPMKIEIVGTNIATPAALPPPTNGMFGDQNGAPRSQGRSGGATGRPRGGGGRGLGRGLDVVVEVVMGVRRYQQTIWMLIWRSTMQKLCKQIDGNEYTVIFICLDLAIGFVTFVLYDFSTLKK